MRRYLLFVLLLCLHWAARGQSGYEYRYWFDGDDSRQHTGTSDAAQWHLDADLSGLTCSLHSIHLQVKDARGVWSAPVTRYFVKPAPTDAAVYYWTDADNRTRRAAGTARDGLLLDVSTLDDGLHIVQLQTATGKGEVSSPRTAVFMKQPVTGDYTYHYWMDGNASGVVSGPFTDEPMTVDVTGLEDGFHLMYFQVEGTGNASVPATAMFIKVPQTEGEGVDRLTCVCSIDGKPYRQEQVPASGGIVKWDIDVASLPQGLHRMQVQAVSPSGAATNVSEHFFFRSTTAAELADMKLLYTVDGDNYLSQAGRVSNGLYHFDVDVSALEDGLHRLTYMLASGTGTSTRVSTAFFVKTPVGGPGIRSYKYWLNDNEEGAHCVELEKRADPFSLISLLPVESCPVRSSCFHFELENGLPVVYAKNDIHFQFCDVSGRVAETSRQYVDYGVSRPVEDIVPLESGVRHTADKPEENAIGWFRVTAVTGDSLSFRTDQACTLRLFSPSGREVYSASGPASVEWGGCHAYEEGTYYLALCDVKGTAGRRISVDYRHIDKYAVLAYTPDLFGTPSRVNVNLLGNGFTDTTRVALYNGEAVYWAKNTTASGFAELTALFEIPDSTEGRFSLKILYTADDSICIDNAMSAVRADSIPEVSVSLEGEPRFIVGTNVNYQVKITNHSNIPVYNLPYTISIGCEDGDENIFRSIKVNNGLAETRKEDFRKWLLERTDRQRADRLVDCVYGDNDMKLFMIYTDTLTGETYLIGNFVLPYLDAYSTASIPFTIEKATRDFKLYASVKKNWNYYNYVNNNPGGDGSGGDGSGGDGSGGDGSGGNGSGGGDGSGGDGSGGNGSGGGDGSGGNGSGGGNGPGGGSFGSGGSECCVMDAANCLVTITTSFIPLGPVADAILETCVYDRLREEVAGIFSDIFCAGDASDFSKRSKTPQPVLSEVVMSTLKCGIDRSLEISGKALTNKLLDEITSGKWGKALKIVSIGKDCVVNPLKTFVSGCGGDDGDSNDMEPIRSYDPNEIRGYKSEAGSPYLRKDLDKVYYTIEFENDPEFATAAAHDVVIADTLDRRKFDLSTFEPTCIKIGDRYVELDRRKSSVTTIDMRPEIYAIAQVEISYNADKGIAKWHFSSLDPMTMEPSDDPMGGFLPVNAGGNGIGEVSFDIGLKKDYGDGDVIVNKAAITFDVNDPIITPAWTNPTDTVAPVSRIAALTAKNDSTVVLRFSGTDNRSGVWKYDLYVQEGTKSPWVKVAENIPDSVYEFTGYVGFNYGFCVLATDSAGNMERKVLEREMSKPTYKAGDANGDRMVDILDVSLAQAKYLGQQGIYLNFEATDVNGDGMIDVMDASLIQNIYLSSSDKRSKARRIRKKKQQQP